MVYIIAMEVEMAKRKRKPLNNAEKIALAVLIFDVVKWLVDLLVK